MSTFQSQPRRVMTVPRFVKRKRIGPPLVMLTAYDLPTARAAEAGGVDALLVGDSLGNVLLGERDTLTVTLDQMIHHARAVGRARQSALLIVDMPWMTYHVSIEETLRNAARIIRETSADAVKLEGGANRVPAIRALLDAEIPVMGHLGLTPQSVLRMGGYKVQGRSEAAVERLVEDAQRIEQAGVFGLVLEGVPSAVAARITGTVAVPTIGIGAGDHCDGQVLVFHDLLGMSPEPGPKFVRRYAEIHDAQVDAIRRWAGDVRQRTFPGDAESYG
ncbi:MAG TPA: 3-methyl-2-oxobutanoate hydroxymethyltransferase [Candidatus Polarisedimenticolaceae bacterium]|nr:3-methyl-2-oxobutanoate hydroxymethyltransferase [Candidatus Polarisedimenticolaceae bacterium]